MHGWVLTDVSFYTFEVPLYAIADSLVGLGPVDVHVVGALTYLIVAALAVALARTGTRGLAAAARSAVVIAVLAVPLILAHGVGLIVENPDHFGTSAFLLGSFLLRDRARRPRRREKKQVRAIDDLDVAFAEAEGLPADHRQYLRARERLRADASDSRDMSSHARLLRHVEPEPRAAACHALIAERISGLSAAV